MDEISPFDKTNVVELKEGVIKEFTIDPKNLGLNSTNRENLKGKNAEYNSKKIIEIFKGASNEFAISVALNAAAGLIIAGKVNDFKMSFERVIKYLKTGNVYHHLTKMQST